MKIKELHIRNIASIEKADIDFENDLFDSVTGHPSSIFLISGDTGTGKTVILDAISMALYKNTPRLDGVEGKQNNSFMDNDGREITINNIAQYTRLGISPKDDCYSELIFEGNDGIIYGARLNLGISQSKKKDSDGSYQYSYKQVTWQYKIGNADWARVEKSGQLFVEATGLTFRQFGRMAMLAQGQFASFLTGSKDERESILEQLTNTTKFSVYGQAIFNLFSAAKISKANAESAYKSKQADVLPPDALEALKGELSELRQQKEATDREHEKENLRLGIVDDIEDFTEARKQAEAEKEKLEAIIAGDEYKRQRQLVTDWDTTNRERQLLSDMKKAGKRKTDAEKNLVAAREKFQSLSSDLLSREADHKKKQAELEPLTVWIEQRALHDRLFSNAAATDLQLGQWSENREKHLEATRKLEQEQQQTLPLTEAVTACTVVVEKTRSAVAAKQEVIDKLQEERKALNPSGTSVEKDASIFRSSQLEKLQERIEKLDEAHALAQQKAHEITQEEESLLALKAAFDASQARYDRCAKQEEETSSLLSTMQMSVNDTVVELRRKLRDTHADTCPLCGQHLATLSDEFSHILTPLQQREQEARTQLETATRQRDADKTAYDKAKGALDTRKKEYAKTSETNGKETAEVKKQASALQLDPSQDLSSQISSAIAQEKGRIAQLAEKLKKAETLQADINRCIEEKKPLDASAQKAERDLQKAQNEVKQNADRICEQKKALAELEAVQEQLATALSTQLSSYRPDWQEDIPAARQHLKADASEYLEKKKSAQDKAQAISRTELLLDSIRHTSESILTKQSGWTLSAESHAYPTTNINGEWTELYAQVERQQATINEAVRTQTEASGQLSAYYAQSGKTEQDLEQVIAQENAIAGARKFVNETDAARRSRHDAIVENTRKIDALLKQLQVEKYEDVPAKSAQTQLVETLATKQQELAGKICADEEKMSANTANEQKLAEVAKDYAQATAYFEKWNRLNSYFGGHRFRTLVQTYILRPLLNNANIYLEKITDRYTLTCSEDNEHLSILVLDRYNKDQIRSATVLSGGERFMISLALSLALSSLNRQDMNVNILFIDEGFGTLDETSLNSVMATLEKLQEIAGQTNRRVGIISHREELLERIPVKINVRKKGEGRSIVEITNE